MTSSLLDYLSISVLIPHIALISIDLRKSSYLVNGNILNNIGPSLIIRYFLVSLLNLHKNIIGNFVKIVLNLWKIWTFIILSLSVKSKLYFALIYFLSSCHLVQVPNFLLKDLHTFCKFIFCSFGSILNVIFVKVILSLYVCVLCILIF